MNKKKMITIISILLILILGIVLIFSLRDEKLDSTYINDSIKVSYYEKNEIVLDKKNSSVDYYFEVESNKDNGSYNISLITENNTNTSDDKIRVSILKNGEYIVGGKETGEVITSDKLSEILSNQTTGKNSKDVYVLKVWSEEVVNNGTFKVSVNVEEVKKEEVIKIKLVADGGKLDKTEVIIKENGTYAALPVPNKEGYRFIGWYSSKDNGVLINKDTKYLDVKANTLYAKYEYFLEVPKEDISNKVEDDKVEEPKVEEPVVVKKEYTITFNSNGGNDIASITKLEGEALGEVPIPQREGYSFIGWDSKYPDVMPSNNLTLNAKWKAKTFVITLMFNETINVTKNVTYDDTYGSLPDVVREGYTFVGWFDSKENGNQIKNDDIVKLTKNITLYARTKANSYTVKFNTGTSEVLEDMVFVYDGEYKDLPVINRVGYRFDGWYFEPEFDNKVNNGDIVKITSDTILFAKYTPNKYTITFDFGYDTLDKEIVFGEEYGELPVATKDGYNFIGWFTEGSDGFQVTKEMLYELSANQKLYARYEAKKFNVSFETYGGSSHEMIQVAYDDIYGTLPTPEKTGYTFNGWYLNEKFNKAITGLDTVKILEDSTLYAKFTANKYTLTMDFNLNVTDMMSKEITYDQPYGDLIQPNKYGYTFMGWYTSKDGGELITEDTIVKVTSDLTIYARWNQSGVLKMYGNTKQTDVENATGIKYTSTQVLTPKIPLSWSSVKKIKLVGQQNYNLDRNIWFCTHDTGWIGVSSGDSTDWVFMNGINGSANKTYAEFANGEKNEVVFTIDSQLETDYIALTWDGVWSKERTYYNIVFYGENDVILADIYAGIDGKFYNRTSGNVLDYYTDGKTSGTVSTSRLTAIYDEPSRVITSVGEKTKNLFPKFSNQTKNGVDLTVADDGVVTLNGSCTKSANFEFAGYLNAGTYSLMDFAIGDFPDNTYYRTQVYDYNNENVLGTRNNEDSLISNNFTISNDNTKVYYRVRIHEGHTYNNVKVKPMLVEGTIEDSLTQKYVPYGFEIPFNVVGKNIVNPQYVYDYVAGMQELSGNDLTRVYTDDSGREVLRLFAGSGFMGVEPLDGYQEKRQIFKNIFDLNTQYTLSFEYFQNYSTSDLNLLVRYTDGSTDVLSHDVEVVQNQIYNYSFTTDVGKTVSFIGLSYNSGTTNIYLDTLQIEKGVNATEYEPYKVKDIVKTGKNLFDVGQVGDYSLEGSLVGSKLQIDDMTLSARVGSGASAIIFNNKKYMPGDYAISSVAEYGKRHLVRLYDEFGNILNNESVAISSSGWKWNNYYKAWYITEDASIYVPNEVAYWQLGFVFMGTTGELGYISDIQLEYGSITSEFETYYEYKNVIYLDEPLRCIDKYCDYIDFEKKVINRSTQKLSFNGIDDVGGSWDCWSNSYTGNSMGVYYRNNSLLGVYGNGLFINSVGLSNYFINTTEGMASANDSVLGKMFLSPNSNPPYFGFKVPFRLLDDWKNYLSEQANKGKSLEAYYVLKEALQEDVIAPDIELNDGETLFVNTSVRPSKIE